MTACRLAHDWYQDDVAERVGEKLNRYLDGGRISEWERAQTEMSEGEWRVLWLVLDPDGPEPPPFEHRPREKHN